MKNSFEQCLVFISVGIFSSGASSAEFINLGFGGLNPMAYCSAQVLMLEYEHPLTPTTAFLARGSGVSYRYDNGRHLEDGRLRGMDVGARYYPAGSMQGWFVGGTIGYWNQDQTFTQYESTPGQWQGKASHTSPRLNIDIGDRIPIEGSKFSIMPEVNIGKFFMSSSCEVTAPNSMIGTPCNQKPEVNYYIFVGLLVGLEF